MSIEQMKQWRIDHFKTNMETAHNNIFTHPLREVFEACMKQVTSGKGEERHGQGKSFYDQPWYELTNVHGRGFLTGQAEKKLKEAQSFEDQQRWLREMYGVIVYAAMAILWEKEQVKTTTSPTLSSDK